ncbi:hypothetical protein CARUB_v10005829mg [Capsella rubella]|uniref:HTH myb-type domain-containing protein n=1 Tax=Capsella rubella TaxID=81985 RepID=R0GYZ6_9BRAS|nr:hypothetical protein CARUB_v10005829mg [Capsella rubella]
MEARTGKSCRFRWFNQLDPTIDKTPFTVEEEKIMVSAHNFYGNKWSKIAKHLKGRTDIDVKNHWNAHMNRTAWRPKTKPNRRLFTTSLNPYGYSVPGNVSYEGIGIKNCSSNMRNEETTNLYPHPRMPVQLSGHHHHFPIFPASGSLALSTELSISQPSSSPEAADVMIRKTPEFIDFLGVGDS